MSDQVIISRTRWSINWGRPSVNDRLRKNRFLTVADLTAGGYLIDDVNTLTKATAGGLLLT